MTSSNTQFASQVLHWFDRHGRHDLPWQHDITAYRVWVSEIMLQQTQVTTVIPYFLQFMQRFPSVEELAAADVDKVLHLWTGLGYYARARNLHKAAQHIVENHGGELPQSVETLNALPGIGQSTAGAIAALSMNIRAPILDGNVKRVLTRYHRIDGWPEQSKVKQRLWDIADSATPTSRVADYTQAMMDLGATVCTRSRPNCDDCPLRTDCQAFKHDCIADHPGKKPRKVLPVKSVAMFIMQNSAGEVLLQKRPPTGIWGSLWSLPESPSKSELPNLAHLGLRHGKQTELGKIRHSFSHYHLDIVPIHLYADHRPNAVMDSSSWLWYPLDHSLEIGLAAPVKKLLTDLARNRHSQLAESANEETP